MIANMKMTTLGLVIGLAFGATKVWAEDLACSDELGTLVRGQFSTNVVNREPADELSAIPSGLERLYYFTEIQGATGASFTYEWSHDGEVVAEVPLKVQADRWRSWSSKQVDHLSSGWWMVKVVGADGCVLGSSSVNYK